MPELDPDPSGPTRRLVDGLWEPRPTMEPGQLACWRIGNIGAQVYYKSGVDAQPSRMIAAGHRDAQFALCCSARAC